ncbi:esterase [Vibrio sp. 10N.286.49.C2]|uniref:alpha/beta fold hydrolase n=1 Tax=unclassified Vibrio TaxID=2614977 RepID=UPI000C83E00B|nr:MULTISPECIES: alpha/beta hydrolase [unclassified Vibrio]PMH35218.1 esterase [Vibrio sp. 10N.286.49.C2]PMH57183.1 esterase [Vibrio sp. 10N.286.49.B1]PMH83598.1 esterase [Vibrio sp. 10N.286.48.B7]
MSDKIYFNTSKKFSFKKRMVNLTTGAHYILAPTHAKNTARRLLLTPVRSKPKNTQPDGLVVSDVKTTEGVLKTYRLGQGPVWILTHGWSGTASQFYPLMEHIAQQGYTALAYDHPAHGESEGQYGHIPGFIGGLEGLLDNENDIAGLVGHSMGTASALECKHAKLVDKPFLLIAPVLDYVDNLFGSVARSGYSMRLFEAVVGDIQDQYRYPIQSIDPYQKLSLRRADTIIVHDRNDKFTKYDVSEQASKEMDSVTLVTTQGQGHGRVMQCQETKESFDRLISNKS